MLLLSACATIQCLRACRTPMHSCMIWYNPPVAAQPRWSFRLDTDLTAVVPATLLVLQARKCRGKQEGHHGCFRGHNLEFHQCRTAPVSCLAMQEHIGHADSEPGNHAPCSSCSLEGALGGDHLPCPGCREGQLQGGPAQKSSSAIWVTKGSRPHRVTWACSRISACRCWGGACQGRPWVLLHARQQNSQQP